MSFLATSPVETALKKNKPYNGKRAYVYKSEGSNSGALPPALPPRLSEKDNATAAQQPSRTRASSTFWATQRTRALEDAAEAIDCLAESPWDVLRRKVVSVDKEETDPDKLEAALKAAEKEYHKIVSQQAVLFRRVFDLRRQIESVSKTSESPEPGDADDNESSSSADESSLSEGERGSLPPHLYRGAVNTFNCCPKKGIKYAQAAGLCSRHAHSVANFLLRTQGLSKFQLGDYLSKDAPYNSKVASAFYSSGVVPCLEWRKAVADCDVLGALEAFFDRIHPPGEAGPLERLINRFTSMYYASNKTQFASKDSIYVLTHALLMLNGNLHKKAAARYKMDMQTFVRNVQDAEDCGRIPAEWLERAYCRLKEQPLKVHGALSSGAHSAQSPRGKSKGNNFTKQDNDENAVNGDSSQPLRLYCTMAGWARKVNKDATAKQRGKSLCRKSLGILNSSRRYFVLTNGAMYYYKHKDDAEPHSMVPLNGCVATIERCRPRSSVGKKGRKSYVTIRHGSGEPLVQVHKSIELRHEFRLCCKSGPAADAWLKAIKTEANLCNPSPAETSRESAAAAQIRLGLYRRGPPKGAGAMLLLQSWRK